MKLWQELHQHLMRQSYVLQVRYEVVRDRDFGASNGTTNGESNGPGSRWDIQSLSKMLIWHKLISP